MGKATATGPGSTRVLIIYYSLSGNTKSIAEKIREKTGGDKALNSWLGKLREPIPIAI